MMDFYCLIICMKKLEEIILCLEKSKTFKYTEKLCEAEQI